MVREASHEGGAAARCSSRPARGRAHTSFGYLRCWQLGQPLAGVADTRPVNFSEEWKQVFKAAGVRKQDLSDPVKATRIALALAESWDAKADLPEMPGFTDKLGPLASLSLGPGGNGGDEEDEEEVSRVSEEAPASSDADAAAKAEMEAAFKVFDADADGSISVTELKAILTRPVGTDEASRPSGGERKPKNLTPWRVRNSRKLNTV